MTRAEAFRAFAQALADTKSITPRSAANAIDRLAALLVVDTKEGQVIAEVTKDTFQIYRRLSLF